MPARKYTPQFRAICHHGAFGWRSVFSFGMTLEEGCEPPGKGTGEGNRNDCESREYDLPER